MPIKLASQLCISQNVLSLNFEKMAFYLTEVAPGIDIQTQILDHMGFVPKMDGEPKLMDERIFKDEIMGLE